MNIVLKCPICKTIITLAANYGIESKTAECPHCHNKNKIKTYLPKLSIKVGTDLYQLHFGRQWIGRDCDNNDAEVKIPDKDQYMSRKHAVLELTCTPLGIQCTFEEHGKNPTLIQDMELIENDIIYLNPNDCFTLGEKKMYITNEFE